MATKTKRQQSTETPAQCTDGHSFIPIGNTYYKNNEQGEGRDNNVVYQMVYCQKCAKTLEIIVCDRRAKSLN